MNPSLHECLYMLLLGKVMEKSKGWFCGKAILYIIKSNNKDSRHFYAEMAYINCFFPFCLTVKGRAIMPDPPVLQNPDRLRFCQAQPHVSDFCSGVS